jgi:putative membrane protein insertion efficiency factor
VTATDFTGAWKRRSRRRQVTVPAVALATSLALTFAYGDAAALRLIRGYQAVLAPAVEAAGIRCRFTPTCSRYGLAVIERDGLAAGGWKMLKRIARCGPWTAAGTSDPP